MVAGVDHRTSVASHEDRRSCRSSFDSASDRAQQRRVQLELKTTLVGTDFSEASAAAIRWAADLAQQLGASLLLSHVVTPMVVSSRWQSYVADVDEERTRDADARLKTLSGKYRGAIACDTVVWIGRPAKSLATLAQERQAGMIAVGLMGEEGADRQAARPGSIAYRLMCCMMVGAVFVSEGVQKFLFPEQLGVGRFVTSRDRPTPRHTPSQWRRRRARRSWHRVRRDRRHLLLRPLTLDGTGLLTEAVNRDADGAVETTLDVDRACAGCDVAHAVGDDRVRVDMVRLVRKGNRARSCRRLLIEQLTFTFAADHDAPATEGAAGRGDDRLLALTIAVVMVEHDPVTGLAQPMRAGGVREECGVVAFAAPGVKHREPCLAGGIEPARRDQSKPTGGCFLAVLAIDIQQLRN